MRPFAAMVGLLVLSGCGGLENEPLTWGIVRGSLVGSNSSSTVSVFGRPELIASPDSQGNFSLRVPQGENQLLALISQTKTELISVEVQAGAVAEVGSRTGLPPGMLELELKAPSFQNIAKGTVKVEGTPVSIRLEETVEWEFRLPAGCYEVQGTVPGLGSITSQGCVVEGKHVEVEFRFPQPDGSPGREGCIVTGCSLGVCRSNGTCGF